MKTIRQISEEMGVSKQTIQKRIFRAPLREDLQGHISVKGGTKYIDDKGVAIIKATYSAVDMPIDSTIDNSIDVSIDKGIDNTGHVDTLIVMLQKELDLKNKQIEDLVADKEYLKNQLKASQFINAGNVQTKLLEVTHQSPQDKKPLGFLQRFFGHKN